MFVKAKQSIKLVDSNDCRTNYNHLSAYINKSKKANPDVTVALQLDDQKRFYHLFMGYPQSVENHTNIMYSFIQTDGFHFKSYQYDGGCIIYCSKTGFGNNVILAFSIVPRENAEHHSWSLQMLWRCSPNMTKSQILFTNCGPLLSAVKTICQELNITVPINFCDRHLLWNIVAKFNVKKPLQKILSTHIQGCAAANTMDLFLSWIEDLSKVLIQQYKGGKTGSVETSNIILYLLKIHPRFWTVFANRMLFDAESWAYQLCRLLSSYYTIIYLAGRDENTKIAYLKKDEN